MPRRHKPTKHIAYRPVNGSSQKARYPSKLSAERAAEQIMLLNQHINLRVYKEIDGGWYLTRQKPTADFFSR